MFNQSEKIENLKQKIIDLENKVYEFEYKQRCSNVPFYTAIKSNPNFVCGFTQPFIREEFTSNEVIGAILNHLNISLEKEHVSASTTVKVVNHKNPKDVSEQHKTARPNEQEE